ncbi:MAG TPA: alpha/beta hydrolase, partial [Spirochaetota bacterium]|nr:alpha/beta hydrolase [Spirochaetota bacterium]
LPLAGFMMGLYGKYSIPISMYLDLEKELMKNGVDAVTFSVNDPQMVRMITFRAMNSLLRTDLAKPLDKITVPVMLIHSDRDNIFPREYVESIYNRLTCKKNYLLFKNTDHLVMTNKPAEVAPEAAKWLRSVIR